MEMVKKEVGTRNIKPPSMYKGQNVKYDPIAIVVAARLTANNITTILGMDK